MTGLEDRQSLSQDIGVAHAAGARLHMACEIAGIDVRTLQRWKAHEGLTAGDGRPQAVRPLPSHALSSAERAELVRVANEPRFAAVPPARIVPIVEERIICDFERINSDPLSGLLAKRGAACRSF
jgi:putative transposase